METVKTLVMGIVNVTPDSFSDGGRHRLPAAAVAHALALVEQGADILDVGGESTRPGATPVDTEEEWRRLAPVLHGLAAAVRIPISVDTYKAEIARRALAAGASIVNDVWGGLADDGMLPLVAEARCGYVWMHNRQRPAADADGFATLLAETRAGIQRCLDAGVQRDRLWIDPGIGFGKTHVQNLEIVRRVGEYCALGLPVLVGASRKRMVGQVVGGSPDQRLEGSLAVAAWCVAHGVRAVRVHDVAATAKLCRMTEAILHG